MIDKLDNERVLDELKGEEYGNHPKDVVKDALEKGASANYENTGELLTDISTAAQRIKAQDTKSRATELVEEYCENLNLSNEASTFGETIIDYLDEETYSTHEADAVAGASTYLSSLFSNEKITMEEVKMVEQIGDNRFRNAYEDVRRQVTEDKTKLVSDFPI